MLYTILIYSVEGVFDQLPEDEQQAILARHGALQDKLAATDALGPFAKLMGTASAMTVRSNGDNLLVTDGPYAETKEQLLGFYMIECETVEQAIEAAKLLPQNDGTIYEIRPVGWSNKDRDREQAARNG